MKRTGFLLALAAVLMTTACDDDDDEGIPKMLVRIDAQGSDSQNDIIPTSLTDSTSLAGIRVDITGLQHPLTLTAADFKETSFQGHHDFTIHNIPQQGTAVVSAQLSQDGEIAAQGEVRLILRGSTYKWIVRMTRALDPIGWTVVRGDTYCPLGIPLDCVSVHRFPIREDLANFSEEALWFLIQHSTSKYACPPGMFC